MLYLLDLRKHLIRHRILGELLLPLKCGENHCETTFNRLFNLLRHVRTYHSSEDCSVDVKCDNESMEPELDETVTEKTTHDRPMFSDIARSSLKDIQAEGEVMVATLRAASSVTYCIIPAAVDRFTQTVNTALKTYKQQLIAIVLQMLTTN